ncbi:N-acetylneuraminate synthase [Desulfarculus baarsii DSM 2075]|uniref:N-acetylneuraminate synthase n=1 Tax=Desulfarculus baarsii (strain ATCC 33931 / DSM 2075 / LMG 7858 / VKM B-1802 / 2st14) TaxID=644282 RepID=E1QFQ9_DESB2|nr:N-acetylneuraminate synthase family protein [Desulfarculus baarsii]ADK84395.1 N-acetylneuraminate synthase [Desulfarculus baarsii DSM 2075]
MEYASFLQIENKRVALDRPTYFVADVAANHDGDLGRAKELIALAKEAGADAVKFQHFSAPTIVSDHGFQALGARQSHQAAWGKSVYQVYAAASLDPAWTPELKKTCDSVGVAFFTSPYSKELVDAVDPFVPAFKVGSGDITWHEIIDHMARKGKPMLLATGASHLEEVRQAVAVALAVNPNLALMQCNTNYTAKAENFRHVNLNVLKTYAAMYPGMVLGLSDHTLGPSTVLGAVALGARVIEKHFTDDRRREGPDHPFSEDPASWREMVLRVRELEAALGSGVKQVADNERETVVLQRRAIRLAVDLEAGATLAPSHLSVLRPCPGDGLPPYLLPEVLGRRLAHEMKKGEHLRWTDLDWR